MVSVPIIAVDSAARKLNTMKIGIMTFYDSYNYGAVLQAYALQQVLAEMQVPSQIIAYKRKKYGVASAAPTAATAVSFGQRLMRKYYTLRYGRALPVRNQRFDDFRTSYLSLSECEYASEEELRQATLDCDAYICGSDQIWNPYHPTFSTLYLLDFVPAGRPRIAYAPSFGVDSISDSPGYDAVVVALREFHALSVREKQGQRIIYEACGREATRVLDPTLLLDAARWSALSEETIQRRPYILFYALLEFSAEIRQLVEETRQREQCDVVVVPYNKHNFDNPYRKEFSAGPLEFLTLVRHARGVITNSFHGTAFAVLFGKPFWSFAGNTDQARRSANRMTDLLELLGLSGRFLAPGHPLPVAKDWPLEFSRAHALLSQVRGRSLRYLAEALSVCVVAAFASVA